MKKRFIECVAALTLFIISIFALSSCGGEDGKVTVNFIVNGEIYYSATEDNILAINAPVAPSTDTETFDGWYLDNGIWTLEFEPNNIYGLEVTELNVYAKYVKKDTPHQHTPTDWIIVREATCTASGIRSKKCSDESCGEQLAMEFIDKIDHDEGDWTLTIKPTCKREGEEVTHCAACNTEINSRKVAVIPHESSDWIKVSDPTCKKEGKEHKICLVCKDELETRNTDKLTEHIPDAEKMENIDDSDCESAGSYDLVTYCASCGDLLSSVKMPIDPKPHTENEAVVENFNDSTCKSEGSYDLVIYCKDCKTELSRVTEPIKIKDHTPTEAVKENEKDSDCKSAGSYDLVIYCSACEAELSRVTETIKVKDHTPAEAVKENENESDCKSAGSYDLVIYCSECEAELSRVTETIKVKDHTPAEAVKENEKDSDCKSAGSYDLVIYCSECKTELSRVTETIKIKDHTPSDWTIARDATCDEDGLKVIICGVCKDTLDSEVIPAAHKWEDLEAREPTETTDGLTAGVACSACGDVQTPQTVIPAKISGVEFNSFEFELSGGIYVYNFNGYEINPKDFIRVNSNAVAKLYCDEDLEISVDCAIPLSIGDNLIYLVVECGESCATYTISFRLTSITVTFDAGAGIDPHTAEVLAGSLIPEYDAPSLTKEGYRFDGWYFNEVKWDFASNTVNEPITLTAKWVRQYTVTFDTDCHLGTFTEEVDAGGLITPKDTPHRGETWSFEGWFIKDTETEWNLKTDAVFGDIILVARWSIMTPPDIW